MAGGVYHERQVGSLCAVHAANNLVGKKTFSKEDFCRIHKQLHSDLPEDNRRTRLQSFCKIISKKVCCYCSSNEVEGNFDANVLMVALQDQRIHLQFWDQRNHDVDTLIEAVRSDMSLGCIINSSGNRVMQRMFSACFSAFFRPNGHWITIKKGGENGSFLNMDSNLKAPREIDLRKFLIMHMNARAHILVASKAQLFSTA